MFDNVLYRKQAFLECQNIDFLKVTKDKKRKFVNFYFFYLCKIGQEKLFSKNNDL